MNKSKYVFAQLIEFLDSDKFRHLVDKYDGNLGREPIAKTTFATANQNRDYHIFEEFAF